MRSFLGSTAYLVFLKVGISVPRGESLRSLLLFYGFLHVLET